MNKIIRNVIFRNVIFRNVIFCMSVIPGSVYAASVADLERQIRASDQARVQMQQQLDQMNQDLNMLIGRLEETNNAISELNKSQVEIYQQISDLSARINQLENGGSTKGSASNGQTSTQQQTKPTQTTPVVQASGNEKDEYQKAVALVMNDKNYSAAITSFSSFIEKYPNSSLISNCYFWLGDSYFKTNRLVDAKQSFLKVIKDQNSVKRAESLYKLGMISNSENNTDHAKKFFQLVVRDYAGTTTAKLAENELKKIK